MSDGILAFLWYIERYLYAARTQHADAYAFILNSECWRNAILTIWGRAWLYLELTEGMSALEIDGPIFFDAVNRPELLGEIQRIRDAVSLQRRAKWVSDPISRTKTETRTKCASRPRFWFFCF